MPIFVGSTEINEIQLGSSTFAESVWVGADKVFRRPRLYDVTVGYRPVASGQNNYGYENFPTNGSISNPQTSPNSGWFLPSSIVLDLVWENYTNSGTGAFRFKVNSGGVLNNDSAFKTLTVNNTVFNIADADVYYNSGNQSPNLTYWEWNINTNPWSGTGNTDRVRFDKP